MAIELESLAIAWAMEIFHHFLIQKPIYPRNQPETLGSHTFQKLESSHTTTPKNSNQDISIQLQDKIYFQGQPIK